MLLDRSKIVFELNTEDYSDSKQEHLISNFLLEVQRNDDLLYDKIEHVFKVYHCVKLLFGNEHCMITVRFSKPFVHLRGDIIIEGARELCVAKNMELFRSVLNSVEAGIEIVPRTDKTICLDFNFFDLEREMIG